MAKLELDKGFIVSKSFSNEWQDDYKGFGIVREAGLVSHNQYSASFSVTERDDNGEPKLIFQGHCKGLYPSVQDAWSAAIQYAREYIDSLE
jgi:hypothetical protein